MGYTIKTTYRDGVVVSNQVAALAGMTAVDVFNLRMMSCLNNSDDTLSMEMFDQDGNSIAAFNFPEPQRHAA